MREQKIINNDCIDAMKQLPSCSIGSIITDPPYEIDFMGKGWDRSGIAFNTEVWTECLRVAKPGAFLMAFGGTRTAHRMAVAIEDSGWICRDYIEWVYGSGFPKAQGLEKKLGDGWSGYKTPALKPAHEPIYIFQKPMRDEGEPNKIDYTATFFYCSKTSTNERNVGCNELENKECKITNFHDLERTDGTYKKTPVVKNNHPCLKPIKLLQYLMKLVAPPEKFRDDFTILDPFMGSGSGGMAAKGLDLNYIGIELDANYCDIARRRIDGYEQK